MKLSALAAALVLSASPALAQSAHVADGDTLKGDGVIYRLWEIDAPEVGPAVRRWMARRTSSNRTLARTDWRTPRHLRTSDARSLRPHSRALPGRWPRPGADMVTNGYAWAFVRYSPDYVEEEREAAAVRAGIHDHTCQPAWQWRADRR